MDLGEALEEIKREPLIKVDIGDQLLLRVEVIDLDSNPYGPPAIRVKVGNNKIWIHFRHQKEVIVGKA